MCTRVFLFDYQTYHVQVDFSMFSKTETELEHVNQSMIFLSKMESKEIGKLTIIINNRASRCNFLTGELGQQQAIEVVNIQYIGICI